MAIGHTNRTAVDFSYLFLSSVLSQGLRMVRSFIVHVNITTLKLMQIKLKDQVDNQWVGGTGAVFSGFKSQHQFE